jgi:3-hydroxyacyl-CoA dehydrogenase
MGKVSTSAFEAKSLKLARHSDVVAFNTFELLYVAKAQARALAESGYRPPLPARRIQVAGDVGIATFKMMLVNMLEGRFISPHDYEIATRIATVLCGGEVDRGALVDEEWLLRLEREHFVELAQMPKTQERIAHMLKTGKPLRN